MNKKSLWVLIFSSIILVTMVTGCIGGGQFGAPSKETSLISAIKGIVVAPNGGCFVDICNNPLVTDGDPLPNANIILKGNNGQTITGKTDCAGNYEITGLTDEAYLLYANRGDVWIKKAISPITGDGGQANYKTTAQVILWEVIESLVPGSISMKDIPSAIPIENIPQDLINAVKTALVSCRDAQKDSEVIKLAKKFAFANFGAPCVCAAPNFVTAVRIPNVVPTPTPDPTPDPSPDPTPDPTPTPKIDTVNIPPSAKMYLYQHSSDPNNPYWTMHFDKELPPNSPGGSGTAGTVYNGWCIEEFTTISSGKDYSVQLYSYNNPPSNYTTAQWDKVNWILNNSSGYDQNQIQQAIWNYTGNNSYNNDLIQAAELYGAGFVPEAGQLMAVVVIPDTETHDYQNLITVVDP